MKDVLSFLDDCSLPQSRSHSEGGSSPRSHWPCPTKDHVVSFFDVDSFMDCKDFFRPQCKIPIQVSQI